MKFKFVYEGSRSEVNVTFGGIEKLNEYVGKYVKGREELLLEEDGDLDYVNEFMEMEFGGINEKCFVEICFGEEDSVKVFIEEK